MPTWIRCSECNRRFRSVATRRTSISCPYCDAAVDWEEYEEEVSARRVRAAQDRNKKILLFGLLGGGVLILLCAGGVGTVVWLLLSVRPTPNPQQAGPFFLENDGMPPGRFAEQEIVPDLVTDYAEARKTFQTQLLRQGPAPQHGDIEQPPAGVREVPYQSGNLRLRAWVSGPPLDGRKRPAVLFLHGGFAFGADDWEQTQPFRDAGFVVMTPTLRGENGLPGSYSMFYNEVEDILAAAETLAKLTYVDSNKIYISGHSVGGTLTMLAAMTSKRFRAAAPFSGSPDQMAWSKGQPQVIPFNPTDQREYQMRSPMAFPASFKCPVRIYFGDREVFFAQSSRRTAIMAKAAGGDVEAVSVPGDHLSMVEPAMRQAIAFFQNHP